MHAACNLFLTYDSVNEFFSLKMPSVVLFLCFCFYGSGQLLSVLHMHSLQNERITIITIVSGLKLTSLVYCFQGIVAWIAQT